MPAVVTEKLGLRLSTGDNPVIEALYTVRGTGDHGEAIQALVDGSDDTMPLLGLTLYRKSAQAEEAGGQIWNGTVRYVPLDYTQPEIGSVSIRGTTKGGTQHITQSIATVSRNAPTGKTAPDFKGAIGVTHDSVEGVDIGTAAFSFSATKVFAADALPNLGTLHNLTKKYNDAEFTVTDTTTGLSITLAPGECLLDGVDFGEPRGDGGVEFTYHFSAGPNMTGITVGDITGIDKKGWEYLWVRYDDAEDANAKRIVKRPTAAYVEKVYYSGDFTQLGLI